MAFSGRKANAVIQQMPVCTPGNITTHSAPRRTSSRNGLSKQPTLAFLKVITRHFCDLRKILVGASRAACSSELPIFFYFKRGVSSISHFPLSPHKKLNLQGWLERLLTPGRRKGREKIDGHSGVPSREQGTLLFPL